MKGKNLVCFTTLVDKDSLSPYTETFEQCFIRPVQPEYLNKGFRFERGSVVDAYAHGGWWKSVIVKEVQNDKFLVYLDFIPDIAKFDKYQLRPNADWTGSKWVISEKKQLSEDIYSPGKIVEMTRRILKMEDIWVPALLIKQIEVDGERKFIIKRMSQFLRLSDDDEEEAILKTVDICKIRPCPPQYFFAKYILGDIVEVFVSCGWLKGEVREILCGNKYLVQFKTLKEGAVYKSSALRPSMDWQDGGWIHTRERESIEETHSKVTSKSNDLMNDGPTATHESSSSTLVLESNEDEILTPEESYSKTTVLEATENPISHESADTMNDDATSPIINPQEIPIDGTEADLMNDGPTATHESSTDTMNDDATSPIINPQEIPIDGTEADLMNDGPTATHESSSSTLVLEYNEDEILTYEESYSKTTVLEATKNQISHESADTMNDDATSPIINPQEIPIDGTEDDLINDAPTPTIATQERSSSTLVLESNEDDMMNGYATEIITPEESYSNTPILEATDNETPINEAVVAYELPLPHESDDACSPIIETQEIPIDPEIHCDLVEDVDIQFGKVLDLVRRGYRLKRQDWLNGSVNIAVAEAEVEKNNYDPWIDATDKEKIEFLTKQAEIYKERVGYLEGLLNIRQENEKENGQNAERELGEEETFQSFIDSRKQQNTKSISLPDENRKLAHRLREHKAQVLEAKLVVYDYDTHVEASPGEDGFQGSWFRAILEQDPEKVKGEKLRPVPPECLNEGVKFKEGLVVDAYLNDGWWNGVIEKKKTREIGGSDSYDCSQHLSDGEDEKCTAVDICKIRPSRPLNLCAEYELQNIVEVFVGYGWRKGVVKEIHIDNHYKVCFEDTKEQAVFKNSDIRRFMEWQNNVWIEAHMKGFENEDNANVPNPDKTSNKSGRRDTFNKNHEMDNGSTIDAEPPIGERMSTSADKIVLPTRVFEPGSEKGVVVKCILGDPELHSNLVEDVDTEFGKVVDLVKRGYRLKRQDWRSGSVNIAVAEAEIEENNYGPGTDATDKEKIEFLTKQLEIYKERVDQLEDLLGIRRETEKETDEFHATPQAATKTKENDKNLEREVEDDVNLQFYIDSRRQQVSKKKTQDEEEQLVDNDAEDGEKERETSKDKEGQIEEAERNGEEVAISGEGSETSKDNEKDEEDNEDASKEPEQVLEKKQGKRKKDRMEEVENVNEDTTNICKEVKKKKPRREKKRNTDEEPVNDDTVVDEDGKADEPNQLRKNKRGRGNKGAGARTSKSKKQKIQPRDVSADDVIGGVLEDLNLKEQEEEEQVDDEADKPVQVEQKKRGRPAGRKNKTHEGKEQQGEANDEAEKPKKGEKNKPGRKGKTNEEKKQQVEADDEVKKAEKGEKKKPGRPAGRKEKKQQGEADDEAEKPEQVEKRKLGRPAGRKRAVAGTSISEKQKTQAGKDSTDDPE
ncbi:hypothetical protein Bca4012_008699 [Brassica carinata]